MADTIIGIALMIISTTWMFLLVCWGYRYVNAISFTCPYLIKIIFFFSFFKIFAYYALPFALGIFSNFRYVRSDAVLISELGSLYFIEMLSWIFWLIGIVLVAKYFRKRGIYYKLELTPRSFSTFLLIFLTILYIPFAFIARASQFGLDVVNLPIFLEVLKSLVAYGGPPASLVLIVFAYRRVNWLYGLIGLLGFVSSLVLISSRGVFVYSLLYLFFLFTITSIRPHRTILKISIASISIVLFYFISGGIPSISLDSDDSATKIVFGSSIDKKGERSAIDELEWRFGAPSRMSVSYIRMYERGDAAGFYPIINSLLGIVPRSINPDKPHPSTVDGTDIYTQGMYLVSREIHGYDTYSMVEFSSGGHAYWELGIIGIIILPLISGIYIGLCAYWFQRFDVVSLALMMAVFKPFGYVDPKIWVSDIVIQIYQLILPLLLLVIIYHLVGFLKTLLIVKSVRVSQSAE